MSDVRTTERVTSVVGVRSVAGVAVALAVLTAALVLMVARVGSPAEDAAMLMRYSANVADGHGIVFNPGGEPVDGATDMLSMLVVAGGVRAGLSPESSMALFNGLALVGLVVGLYLWVLVRRGPVWFAVATGVVVLTSRGLYYLQAGFAAPIFGLSVLGLWAAVETARDAAVGDRRWFWAAGLAGVIAGLVRPEGFLLAGLGVVSLLITMPRARWVEVARMVVVLVVGGSAFVAWRWWYFGYPLPNPFYVKGGGTLHVGSFIYSAAWTVLLGWLGLVVVGVAVLVPATRRRAVAQAVAISGAVGMWLLLSNAMNLEGRFQFPVAVIAWASAASLVAPLLGDERLRRPVVVAAGVVTVLIVGVQVVQSVPRFRQPTRPVQDVVASALADSIGPGRDDRSATSGAPPVVVTTEAGLIPLRSGWTSVDAYGLNDQPIAHAGGIDRDRLLSERPDVVVVHGPYATDDSAWSTMVRTLADYAETSDYMRVVELSEGSDGLVQRQSVGEEPWDWAIYVREDSPVADRVTTALERAEFDGTSITQ